LRVSGALEGCPKEEEYLMNPHLKEDGEDEEKQWCFALGLCLLVTSSAGAQVTSGVMSAMQSNGTSLCVSSPRRLSEHPACRLR
jgi:hypothetical protein